MLQNLDGVRGSLKRRLLMLQPGWGEGQPEAKASHASHPGRGEGQPEAKASHASQPGWGEGQPEAKASHASKPLCHPPLRQRECMLKT